MKKSDFKIFKLMNSTSKIKFNHLLLGIAFNDKFLKISTWFSTFEYITQHKRSSWKKIQFEAHFVATFRPLTKKIMVLVYWKKNLVHFTMLARKSKWMPKINCSCLAAKSKKKISKLPKNFMKCRCCSQQGLMVQTIWNLSLKFSFAVDCYVDYYFIVKYCIDCKIAVDLVFNQPVDHGNAPLSKLSNLPCWFDVLGLVSRHCHKTWHNMRNVQVKFLNA